MPDWAIALIAVGVLAFVWAAVRLRAAGDVIRGARWQLDPRGDEKGRDQK